jgi:hypothetical protein
MQSKDRLSTEAGQNNGPLHITDHQFSIFLEDTQATLAKSPDTFNAKAGVSMIEMWETILESSGKPGLAKILYELKKLKEHLQAGKTDPHDVAASLATLGDETKKVADNTVSGFKGPLMEFGNLLVKAGSSLSK